MLKIYHGSNTGGLKKLSPKVSSHDKPYVYGSINPSVALLFLARWNDYIFRVGYDEDQLFIVENYEGALKSVFHNVSGYLYELEPQTFIQKKELWRGEVVSSFSVDVLKETKIQNIYKEIVNLDKFDDIKVYNYPLRPKMYPANDQDLINRLLLNIKRNDSCEVDKFLSYHPKLEDRVRNAISESKK